MIVPFYIVVIANLVLLKKRWFVAKFLVGFIVGCDSSNAKKLKMRYVFTFN